MTFEDLNKREYYEKNNRPNNNNYGERYSDRNDSFSLILKVYKEVIFFNVEGKLFQIFGPQLEKADLREFVLAIGT